MAETTLERLLRAARDSPGIDATDERILDGALSAVAAYGPARATMDDIAEAAGVGRATVFRRFGAKEAVLSRLREREVSRFLAEADRRLDAIPDMAERVVEAFTLCVRTARRHPWLERLVRTEPQHLVELLRQGDPSPLTLAREFVASRLREDHPGAVARPGADQRLAELLIRLAFAYVMFPSELVDFDDRRRLRAFATEMILPVVTGRMT
ncbi:helix-turn-helix domain containing protein [Amycolatopsis cynarae]|uniref:Helix-turn-helix domain containing protein n=1 Tax=Amycolatopsis cynarae TaxID=2995223 RepID=A0ABY7B456_9PSEU|nr:TetR/AcrR family transcriptional regulator [Amycolatopsis sp. HUAS 11-8]WAL66717.1 helix-turn-helix domain containing protein [Amycolatopsis sp. HUAS 11-8]